MLKAILAVCISAGGLALAGCAGFPDGGRNLNGFPVDYACYNFWANDPFYGGNVAIAYATNCTAGGGSKP